MDKPQAPEAAETVQTTSVPTVDLPRLIRQSYFGTVRLTIGCMDRMCQVTYYDDQREKHDIRGTSQEVAAHINSLPNVLAFGTEWKPLVEHLGEELCGHFMFMASYPTNGGRTVHTYKHHDTRRYLNIDEEGVFYRYEGGGYAQITADAALSHALANTTDPL